MTPTNPTPEDGSLLSAISNYCDIGLQDALTETPDGLIYDDAVLAKSLRGNGYEIVPVGRIAALEDALRDLNGALDACWNDPHRIYKTHDERHRRAITAAQIKSRRALTPERLEDDSSLRCAPHPSPLSSDEVWRVRRASRFQAFEEASAAVERVRGDRKRVMDDSWQEAAHQIRKEIILLQDEEVRRAKAEGLDDGRGTGADGETGSEPKSRRALGAEGEGK